jgi:hypothetical protein
VNRIWNPVWGPSERIETGRASHSSHQSIDRVRPQDHLLNKSKELLDRLEKDDGTRLIVLGVALRQGSMSVTWRAG